MARFTNEQWHEWFDTHAAMTTDDLNAEYVRIESGDPDENTDDMLGWLSQELGDRALDRSERLQADHWGYRANAIRSEIAYATAITQQHRA